MGGRKSVRGVNIEDVYQTRLTTDEKKHVQSTLAKIKRLLMYSRQYTDETFCYSTNGSIIAAALTDYCTRLETFLQEHGDTRQ